MTTFNIRTTWTPVVMAMMFIVSSNAMTENKLECDKFDYLATCSNNLQQAFSQAQTEGNATNACTAIGTYINCVEFVACQCNLTQQSSVHNQLTYITGIYAFQNCQSHTGPLITNKGIPCNENGNGSSTEGDLLVLSTATSEIVVELEDTCSGVQACYNLYDTNAAQALHARNLSGLCSVLDSTIKCLESAACSCGESTNDNITDNVKSNHAIYRQTCNIISSNIGEKDGIVCSDNGTTEETSVCHTGNPIYQCYLDLDNALTESNTKEVRCPALKQYIECTEGIACNCGLIRSPAVYRAVTVAAASFNDSVCAEVSGPLVVVSGMDCPDGTGTTEEEDRLLIALSEDPSVVELDSTCPGIKTCYSALDEATGIALFEKNIKKLCAGQKVFIECMEETYCQCGFYGFQNTTTYLSYQRENHVAACFTDAVLREDFKCEYGSIGFKCMDNSDCEVISQSECTSGSCTCTSGTIYIPEQNTTACVRDMRGTVGHPCSSGDDCQLVDHSECGTGRVCACTRGYTYQESTCKKEATIQKEAIGYRCSSQSDCDGIPDSQCGTGGVCACQAGYVYSDKKCSPVSSAMPITSTFGTLTGMLILCITKLL